MSTNYLLETCIYYVFNASLFSFLLYVTLKFCKRKFGGANNEKFYNNIISSKTIYIINEFANGDQLKEIIDLFQIKSEKFSLAGFDCEWAPNENISLIQIAFPDGYCFLIRLREQNCKIPIEIINWMKDFNKLKFGIGVIDDGKKLENQWEIVLRGCVDLRHLANRIRPNGLTKMGLKSFAKNWLGVLYPYDDVSAQILSVQCSDWSQSELDSKQIEYASLDALVGSLCPVEFLCRKQHLCPVEALEKLESIRAYCQGCIDHRFKSKMKSDGKSIVERGKLSQKSNSGSYYQRASPIYDNSVLLTPDGQMLSRLSIKKAEWYLRKGLGERVSQEPLVVRLLFEPSGRASGENDYYIQEKENLCVVCGSKDGCVKKNIIPIEYRRHYPVSHKSHKSHDVLPLCVSCHRLSNVIDDKKKKSLATEYDAPLGSRESVLNKTDFGKSRVKNAAKALMYQNKIPIERIKELRQILIEYYQLESLVSQIDEIPHDVLEDAVKLETATRDGKFVPHGQKVVSTLTSSISLVNFEVMWREHFVELMQPQFLPIGWSTHHRIDRYCAMEIE